MSSHKRLNSVAHSLAHHAVSGLSYVNPHLSEACEKVGLHCIEIELLTKNSCPLQFLGNEPLELSLNELKLTLMKILKSEDYEPSQLKSAKLEFSFYHDKNNYYSSDCKATLHSTENRIYEKAVNYFGETIRT